MDVCVICEDRIIGRDGTTLRRKGCDGIIAASQQRGDEIGLRVQPGNRVHAKCRKDYTEANRIQSASKKRKYDDGSQHTIVCRSEVCTFNIKEQCVFCECGSTYNERKDKGHKLIPVRTMDFEKNIKAAASVRCDRWSEKVLSHIQSVHDLPAADATYHQCCSVNFRTGKDIPQVFSSDIPEKLRGRHKDISQTEAFLSVMTELDDNDDEQITMVRDYFGDRVMISEVQGKPNVVVFTNTVSNIIQDFHNRSKQDDNVNEKMALIETAAKLIKCDIRSINQSRECYPSTNELEIDECREFVPESLRLLLQCLFSGTKTDVKVASLGQAITQATRPRSLIAPLQLSLGIQLHHQFGSRFLIDSLNQHGFCASYAEITRFERSSAVSGGTDIPECEDGHFIQYVADNADHNTRTIDGKNTFHGMGMIAAVTPGTKHIHKLIPRVKVTTEDIISVGHVNIKHFKPHGENFRLLSYNNLPPLHIDDPTACLDTLWKGSLSI